jgi:hypothetical protein
VERLPEAEAQADETLEEAEELEAEAESPGDGGARSPPDEP